MHYYLALTSKCNLLCKYCYGKTSEDFLSEKELGKYDLELPDNMNFDIETLKSFAIKDPDFELTFYGGEPLLKIDMIKKIMDVVPAKKFMLQTNGIFLHKLEKEYINRFNTILVSIDGTLEHTDERRGKNTFKKIVDNLNLIKNNGFNGEIIARMTVDETCDIYENVRFLLDNKYFSFSSVHWQIDAQFWMSDYETRDFKGWSITKYNPGISKLLDWWIDEMKNKGIVHKIYPFIGIVETLHTKERTPMRCGSGFQILGIQTDGKVVACPITAGYKPFYMGDIRNSKLEEIKKNNIFPDGLCNNCEIKDICGGRCLYANKTMLWGEKGFNEVCDTVFFLVNSIKERFSTIEQLIKSNNISWINFNYEKYNGCEIIP